MDTGCNTTYQCQVTDDVDLVDTLHLQMVVALLSTICMAIHTACAAYAAKLQIDRGVKGSRRILFFSTISMYIVTIVSWIASVFGQFQAVSFVRALQLCESFSGWDDSIQNTIGTGALTINVLIGDGIVWWRVWVLWNKNRAILIAASLILIATLGLGILSVLTASLFFDGPLGLSTIVLSIFSNIVSVLLVGYKAWQRRRNMKSLRFARVSSVNQVQRVLMLLFECGIAYCFIWALVLVSELWKFDSIPFSASLWNNLMAYFIEGCLVALVGIYPTLIIVLIALEKSKIAQELTSSFVVSAGLTPRGTAPATIQADIPAHPFHAAESANIDDNAWRDTIMLIRLPSQEGSDSYSTHLSRPVAEGDTELGECGVGEEKWGGKTVFD